MTKVNIKNTFHNTETSCKVRKAESVSWEGCYFVTVNSMTTAFKKMCGNEDCKCATMCEYDINGTRCTIEVYSFEEYVLIPNK